jgi:putative nucleotidyltransferase with HDIG domain
MAMSRARPWYRLQQFLRAIEESRGGVPSDTLDAYLEGDGRRLFAMLSRRDQVHSAHTAARVLQARPDDFELAAAALLHDVGKGDQRIWHRVTYVLLGWATPPLLARLARADDSWRGALYRSLHHPLLGAQMVQELGYAESVCGLIARHHEATADPRLSLLQWADEVA